jgi:pimeloyl-ACP methyl ester carboxylesterase
VRFPVLAILVGVLAAILCAPANAAPGVHVWKIHYLAHDGVRRAAYVALPSWYGPGNDPEIPLIISPHGRGLTGRENLGVWGSLPAEGQFAVVSPDGQGRVLPRYSWGSKGQVDDLARMPRIVQLTLPWLKIARNQIYAFGGSMGGQETLLLLALHPDLLAGAAAFDAVTDFARQYRSFPRLGCNRRCQKTWGRKGAFGYSLQEMARVEVGGSPKTRHQAYAERSPLTFAGAIASSCVPLQLWWSTRDRIVLDQSHQSGRLFDRIRQLNPNAPVTAIVGDWAHSAEMTAATRLPQALARFALLPLTHDGIFGAVQEFDPPAEDCLTRR